MKPKIIFIFILTIFIPTSLLAYFGLLAVRSEKSIVEKNMMQKYNAMADIVEGEIRMAIRGAPNELLANTRYWERLLLEQAAIFKDEVVILDRQGRPLGDAGTRHAASLHDAVLSRAVANLPYILAVYERYPLLLEQLEQKKKGLFIYVSLIMFAAFSILGGGVFTLWALSREWRFAELKSEFVSHLSHDLRRPLTSIRMFSEMLMDEHAPSEEKRLEYYKIISNESDRLTHLADNILDFSRIERRRIRYNFQEADVAEVVRQTVERFRTYMVEEERLVTLSLIDSPYVSMGNGNQGYHIKIDANAISQALMNLLSNAAKYSAVGTEISVNLLKGKKEVVIEVIDQGSGIPKSEQKKIFRKFYRVPRKEVAQIEGSGLGLTLVKYTAEAHGGRVLVESEEGKGSKFSIVLPVT